MIAMQDGLRVLFVEDEPLVRQATAQSLELAGFSVLALPSAEAAMPHLGADFPGVLVTDVRLSGASGLDLLQHCRNAAPGVPVILVTGHGDITMAVQAMQALARPSNELCANCGAEPRSRPMIGCTLLQLAARERERDRGGEAEGQSERGRKRGRRPLIVRMACGARSRPPVAHSCARAASLVTVGCCDPATGCVS